MQILQYILAEEPEWFMISECLALSQSTHITGAISKTYVLRAAQIPSLSNSKRSSASGLDI